MRRKALGCLVVGVIGATAAGSGRAASAPEAGRTFAASAEAEGLRVTFDAPQFLVVSTLFDAANPISQATLESTGVSRSFASAPYPGDLVVTAPGTLAAFGGPSLPAQYPFHVAAVHPDTPEATLDGPGGVYNLAASAEAAKSAAAGLLAVEKGPVVRTEALTETLADGTVRAVASSITEGIVAGDGALTIGRVVSSVETVSRPGAAEPAVTRRFEITGARVGDTVVEITADGVTAGGGALPAGEAAKPVQAALAQAGVDVKVEGEEPLSGGGTARTLVIRSTQQAPVPGAPQGVLTIRVGGAATAVLTGAAAVVEVPGSVDTFPSPSAAPEPLVDPGAAVPVVTTEPADALRPVGPGAAPYTAVSGSSASPASISPTAGGGVPDPADDGRALVATGPETAPIAAVPTALAVRRAVRWIFVVLGAGGALALAGSAMFRRQGVQSTWTF